MLGRRVSLDGRKGTVVDTLGARTHNVQVEWSDGEVSEELLDDLYFID